MSDIFKSVKKTHSSNNQVATSTLEGPAANSYEFLQIEWDLWDEFDPSAVDLINEYLAPMGITYSEDVPKGFYSAKGYAVDDYFYVNDIECPKILEDFYLIKYGPRPKKKYAPLHEVGAFCFDKFVQAFLSIEKRREKNGELR